MSQALLSLSRQATISMSPRLQHAIRLLQLPAMEFEQELQNALANNPFLEESSADGDGAEDEAPDERPLPDGLYPDRDGARTMRNDGDWDPLSQLATPGDLLRRARGGAAPQQPRDEPGQARQLQRLPRGASGDQPANGDAPVRPAAVQQHG